MWLGIPALILGLPGYCVAYGRWREKRCNVDIDVVESMQLTLDRDTMDWGGSSSHQGTNLQINVCPLDETNHYDVELVLRNGTTILDSYTWHDVTIGAGPPFDSGLLRHVVVADNWYYEVHVRG